MVKFRSNLTALVVRIFTYGNIASRSLPHSKESLFVYVLVSLLTPATGPGLGLLPLLPLLLLLLLQVYPSYSTKRSNFCLVANAAVEGPFPWHWKGLDGKCPGKR